MTDNNGNVVQKNSFYPFGAYQDVQGYLEVNYTFTGQEDDDELGLYNYNARLYDPVLGRFISADTIVPEPGNLQSLNRYSYCLNNPLIYIDPSGHWGFRNFLKSFVVGAVAAVVAYATAGYGLVAMGTAAGAAAGSTSGLLSGGGLQGMVIGAALGGTIGALSGGLMAGLTSSAIGLSVTQAGWRLAAAGAGVAYATGGTNGLLDFASGFAGAYLAGSAIAYAKTPTPLENTPGNMYDENKFTPAASKGRPLTVSEGEQIVEAAEQHKSAPYKWGGNDLKTGIDCSHFVNKVYNEAGFPYEYSSTTAFPSDPHFSPVTNPQPGDVGVWSGRHMTIYTGNGNTFGAFGAGREAGPLPVSRFSFPSRPTWYRYHTP